MFREKYHHMNDQIIPDASVREETIRSVTAMPEKPNGRAGKYAFRRPAVVLTILMVCTVTAMPVLAATVPGAYEIIYSISPSAAQFFMPVQKSCVDNGIEMEVASVYVHDSTIELYVTMRDLTGNRIDETIDLFDSYSIRRPFDSSANCRLVHYDEESKAATFLIAITEWGNRRIEGGKITFSAKRFLSHKREYNDVPIAVDLSELESDLQTRRVELRGGGGPNYLKYRSEDGSSANVIHSSEPMDFPVEGIEFTGIGYVDDMLHIQTAVTDNPSKDNHGYFILKDADGNEIEYDYGVSFMENNSDGDRVDYDEYVFNIPQSQIGEYALYGTFVTGAMLTEGDWQITFPIS